MTSVSLCELRRLARELAREACEHEDGSPRSLGDRVFNDVTQGRAGFPGYSACGDLCHYVLEQLFSLDVDTYGPPSPSTALPSWVNRDRNGRAWRVGKNISALVFESKCFVFSTSPKVRPVPGDMLLLGAPEHVCVLESWDDDGTVVTWDYGQRDAKMRPSARARVRHASGSKPVMLSHKPLLGWLSLERVFHQA